VERYYLSSVLSIVHRSVTRQLSLMSRVRSQSFRRRVRRSSVHSSVFAVVIVRRRPAHSALERPRPAAKRRLLRGGRTRRQVAPPLVARERGADEGAEDAAEALAEDAVDDEVGRRVDDDQKIAQMRGVDERVRTVLVLRLLDRLEDGEHAVRRVTQQYDHDDDDDNVGDVLLLRTEHVQHFTSEVARRRHSN